MKPLKQHIVDGVCETFSDRLMPEDREVIAAVAIAACRRWLELRWSYWQEDVRQLLNHSTDFEAELIGALLGPFPDAREALDNLSIDRNTESWIFRALLLLMYEEMS